MKSSVLVLGGCGAVGSVVVKELLQMTDASIVIGDHNFAHAKRYANSLKNERVTAQFIQGENENELIPVLKNFDLLADCTNIRHHYKILEAAIEAGVNYYCLTGSLYLEKLKLDAKAKKAGITAILAIGSSPGLTNLLAKRAADELDEVEEIQITFLPYRAISLSPGLLDTFLHQFFEEEKARCYYKNGELIPVPPFSGERTIYLPEPFGPREVYYMAHAETTMLAKSIKGVKLIETRGAWPQEIMEAIKIFYEYNFFSNNQIQIDKNSITPRNFLREHLLLNDKKYEGKYAGFNIVEVIGKRDGRTIKKKYMLSFLGETPDTVPQKTGIMAGVAGTMFIESVIKEKGVLLPEMGIDPEDFVSRVRKRGVRITETTEKDV